MKVRLTAVLIGFAAILLGCSQAESRVATEQPEQSVADPTATVLPAAPTPVPATPVPPTPVPPTPVPATPTPEIAGLEPVEQGAELTVVEPEFFVHSRPDINPHVYVSSVEVDPFGDSTHEFLHAREDFSGRHHEAHESLFAAGATHDDIHGVPSSFEVNTPAYCAELAGVLPLDRDNRPPNDVVAASAEAAAELAPLEHRRVLLDIAEANRNPDTSTLTAFGLYNPVRPLFFYGLGECGFVIPGVRLGPTGENLIFSLVFPSDEDADDHGDTVVATDVSAEEASDEPADE